MSDDLISRQEAIRLVHSVLYEMMVDAAATDIEKPMSKEDKLLLRVNRVVCAKLKELPSAESDPSDVARAIATIIENEKDMRVIAQPEIVRCKDCRHWKSNEFIGNNDVSTILLHTYPCKTGITDAEWYCAYAERER